MTAQARERTVDVLVVGSGVAGLSVALGVTPARSVLVVDREPVGGGGSTRWAQGGIATIVDPGDDPAAHAADTSEAGAHLCDARALTALVENGPAQVAELITLGASFDRGSDGRLLAGLEGGHRRNRVVHAGGDATGAEIARVLEASALARGVERVHARVTGLLMAGARVVAAQLETSDGIVRVRARAVVLATGGVGGVYPTSTNPASVGGDGLALALRAGATLTDMEFVQFHPTVLHTGSTSGQQALISEALRGAGAVLRDADERPFMRGRHPLADLAPRDVVARAVQQTMSTDGRSHVWLDARHIDSASLERAFPTVLAACRAAGVEPTSELIPVTSAQHFLCGGVRTDTWGASDVPGLWAVGETAATGVHGANRLASNSMLEGLVFGRRAAARLVLDLPGEHRGDVEVRAITPVPGTAELARSVVGAHAGLTRSGDDLATAAASLHGAGPTDDPTWLVASAVIAAARTRCESRGTHFRTDHPEPSDDWRVRIAVRLDAAGDVVAERVEGSQRSLAA